MKSQQAVQYALLCLQDLGQSGARSRSREEISRSCGIPSDTCQELLRHLTDAGILATTEDGQVRLARPLEELTSLDIVQAVWSEPKKITPFRLLYQSDAATTRKTLEAVGFAQTTGAYPGEAA